MKIKRLRKRQQLLFKRHRAYYWSVQKLANRIFEAYAPVGKALQDAYAKGSFSSVIVDDDGGISVVEIPWEDVYERGG